MSASKASVRSAMTNLRGTMRYLDEMLKAGEWQSAYFAAQDLVATSVYIEEILADRPEVTP